MQEKGNTQDERGGGTYREEGEELLWWLDCALNKAASCEKMKWGARDAGHESTTLSDFCNHAQPQKSMLRREHVLANPSC